MQSSGKVYCARRHSHDHAGRSGESRPGAGGWTGDAAASPRRSTAAPGHRWPEACAGGCSRLSRTPLGAHALIVESSLPEPTLTLAPGDYVVHVAFGLASATRRLTLGPEVRAERLPLSAGALRIEGTLADQPIDPAKLSLAIYVPENRNPLGKLVDAKAKAGDIIGLPEGAYHIVSTYLDTVGGRFSISAAANTGKSAVPATPVTLPSNSIVNADIKVVSGKLVDVTLRHRCATLTLKLVNKPGGEALANTTFTVLTPGGDVIRELDRRLSRRWCSPKANMSSSRATTAKTYQSTFEVQSGMDRDVEVVAQENAKRAARTERQGQRRLGATDRMQTFFVQIKCALGRTYEVASALAEAEIASEIYSIAGDFDILSKFYVERDVDIGHFVGQKVQTIPGIVDTRTIITFKAF